MKRIMIVDDSIELGRVLQGLILRLDPSLDIVFTPSAEEALLEVARRSMDLVISDLRLPGLSGVELMQKIIARQPAVRFIFMTGLSDNILIHQAQEMKPDGFFKKPIDFNAFEATIRRSLGLEEASAQTAQFQTMNLTETLSGLQHRLGATAVFIMDENHKITAQAGEVPALSDQRWGAALSGLNSAMQPAAGLVGGTNEGVSILRGTGLDLAVAPLGKSVVAVLLRRGASSLRLALAVEEVLNLQAFLQVSGSGIQPDTSTPVVEAAAPTPEIKPAVKPQPVVAVPPVKSAEPPKTQTKPEPAVLEPTQPVETTSAVHPVTTVIGRAEPSIPDLSSFADLFDQPGGGKVENADAFWENATLSGPTNAAGSGISYDQASRLGLTPREDDSEEVKE